MRLIHLTWCNPLILQARPPKLRGESRDQMERGMVCGRLHSWLVTEPGQDRTQVSTDMQCSCPSVLSSLCENTEAIDSQDGEDWDSEGQWGGRGTEVIVASWVNAFPQPAPNTSALIWFCTSVPTAVPGAKCIFGKFNTIYWALPIGWF